MIVVNKYFAMWGLNVSVVYFVLSVNDLNKFLTFYLNFIVFASALGLFLHFSGIFYSANPFFAFNKNSYIFCNYPGLLLLLYFQGTKFNSDLLFSPRFSSTAGLSI